MKSTGNYFYVKKTDLKKNYTQIPNSIFALKLSATEKLILIYLFSNSEEFRITNYRIKESIGSSYRAVKKALDKFQKSGIVSYLNCNTIQINTGVFDSVQLNTIQSDTSQMNTIQSTTSHSDTIQTTHTNSGQSTTIDGGQTTTNSGQLNSKIVVERHINNTNEQDEEKKNNQKELTKRSQSLDSVGGGVQPPVTLATPPMGSLASPTASHTPTIELTDDKIMSYIKSYDTFQSKYFGSSLHIKFVRLYETSNEIKTKLTYGEFEEFFLYISIGNLKKQLLPIDRTSVVKNLNDDFDNVSNRVIPMIQNNIELYKERKEKWKVFLQAYKL